MKIKKLNNLKLRTRTKVYIPITAVLVVAILLSSAIPVADIKLGTDGSGVNWFGAIDVITNSNGKYWTATGANIQLAIEDLTTGNGTVNIPAGTFNGPFYINKSGITLQGQGGGTYHGTSGTTIFTRTGNNVILNISGASGSHIRKPKVFDINFKSDRNTYVEDAITVSYATFPSFERCGFFSINGSAIRFIVEVYGNIVKECCFNACSSATRATLHYSDDITFSTVTYCIFENDYVTSILSDTTSKRMQITNNYMEATSGRPTTGFIYGKITGGDISSNQIAATSSAGYGIYLSGDKNFVSFNFIQKCSTGIKSISDYQRIIGNYGAWKHNTYFW